MTLVEFLAARIAEDEAVRWQPARARAEYAAKRAIVEFHVRQDWLPEGRDECSVCGCADCHSVAWPCETLRILAAIHADHPDYDASWAV